MHNIFLDGKCDTMNILVETGTFGAVLTDGNYAYGYYIYIYIYIYTSIPHKMQVETIVDGQIICNGERVVNVT